MATQANQRYEPGVKTTTAIEAMTMIPRWARPRHSTTVWPNDRSPAGHGIHTRCRPRRSRWGKRRARTTRLPMEPTAVRRPRSSRGADGCRPARGYRRPPPRAESTRTKARKRRRGRARDRTHEASSVKRFEGGDVELTSDDMVTSVPYTMSLQKWVPEPAVPDSRIVPPRLAGSTFIQA